MRIHDMHRIYLPIVILHEEHMEFHCLAIVYEHQHLVSERLVSLEYNKYSHDHLHQSFGYKITNEADGIQQYSYRWHLHE